MKFIVTEKRDLSFWLFAVFLVCAESDVSAQRAVNVYAPAEAITVQDGNSHAVPFDTAGRFQQVYDSSVFSSRLPVGGGFIEQLVFRVDAIAGHSFIDTIPNIQLNLSTTLNSPDRLSSLFADNVGSDDSAVLGPRSVLLDGAGGGGVTGFGVLFDFRDNPFYYNPASGNLLVDFRVHQGPGGPIPPPGGAILDAFNVTGDSVSSVYASGSSSLTSGQISTLGLATDFVFSPIPEPSAAVLLLANLVGALAFGWKRGRNENGLSPQR